MIRIELEIEENVNVKTIKEDIIVSDVVVSVFEEHDNHTEIEEKVTKEMLRRIGVHNKVQIINNLHGENKEKLDNFIKEFNL